ncbi:MAG: TetR/AcrR family transcriptional regulator [Methylocystaceae bacterium]|nr:MAG: TetR/AcrR family transcriptional regulator [Methylocystaceae bacterium]
MRYDAEHKARTRARILKEAAKAIRSEGPHRIRVAGVMSRAGLTHGGFYAHFSSKDNLVAEAITQMFHDSAASFDRVVGGRPPAEAISAFIDYYLSSTHRDARDTGCPLAALSTDLPRLKAAARTRFADGVTRLTTMFSSWFEALGSPDPGAEAASTLAELVGAIGLARAVPSREQSNAILSHSRMMLKRRLGIEGATAPRPS